MGKRIEELYKGLFTNEPEMDEEVKELSDIIRDALELRLEDNADDEVDDNNLLNILLDDEYLTEELVDKLSLVNLVEQPAEKKLPDETIENTYLSLLDTFYEMSKTINPLGGFNKARLMSALEIARNFEERYWPLSTKITAANIKAFDTVLSEMQRDDILVGRKWAIGALRHVGKDVYAAGVICYSVDRIGNDKAIRIEYINVHETMRGQGIGNFLMAEVLGVAIQNEGMSVTVDIPVKHYEGENEELRGSVLSNFLDSWRFQFVMAYGRSFVLLLKYLKGNKYIDKKPELSVSLKSLGDKGKKMLREFFSEREYDADIVALPYGFFDPDVSCAIVSDGKIRSVFLVHGYGNGNYKYEALRCAREYARNDYLDMLRFAYKAASEKVSRGKLLYGYFDTMEGRDILADVVPDLHLPMTFSGMIEPPENEITSEMWDELRREAGLSDDKLPDDDDTELSDEEMDRLKAILAGEASEN